ncbi:MAG: DinB family protein [Acidobacteriota bacterium]
MTFDLSATVDRLIASINALTPETRRRWGTLEPGEMLCHIVDVNDVFLNGGGGPEPGAKVRRRPIMKWLAFHSPHSWSRGWKTDTEVDPKKEGTKPQEFETDRERAIASVRAIASAPADAFAPNHYLFGPLTADEWRRVALRHTEYHLCQFGV